MRYPKVMPFPLLAFLILITSVSLSEAQPDKAELNSPAAPNSGTSSNSNIAIPILAVAAAAASAGAALYSVYMNHKTRKLLEPTERPAFDLQKTDIKWSGSSAGKVAATSISVSATFKNVGKHPATNLEFRCIVASIGELSTKAEHTTKACPRVIYPDVEHLWSMTASVSRPLGAPVTDIIMLIKPCYEDTLQPNTYYEDCFYLILSGTQQRYATSEELQRYKKFLEKSPLSTSTVA